MNFSPSRLFLIAALAAALGCAACRPAATANAAPSGQRPGPAAEALPVETVAAVVGPIAAALTFNTTLETEAAVDLYPQVAGQVEAVLVEEGDRVAEGAVLLRIDDRELQVEAREAEVSLANLEASFGRVEEMFRRGMVNQQEHDDRRFQLEQARLRLERARLRLDQATVRAPFAGVISAREVQAGARVAPATKLFSLVALDEMIAVVHVPGRHLGLVRAEQAAEISSSFLPERQFAGHVKRIAPVIDPRSGTFRVTVGVDGAPEELKPGLFVAVRIITETRPEAVLVPKRAIVYEGGERFLFTVTDGRAAKLRLEAGFEDARHVEALRGVAAGTPVIVVGQNGLRDGAAVRVVGPPVAAPAAATPAG